MSVAAHSRTPCRIFFTLLAVQLGHAHNSATVPRDGSAALGGVPSLTAITCGPGGSCRLLQAGNWRVSFSAGAVLIRAGVDAIQVLFRGVRQPTAPQPAVPLMGQVYALGSVELPARRFSTYGAVVYRNVYPGIDAVYRAAEGGLKSEFILHAGARIDSIRIAYKGAESVRLLEDGTLLVGARGMEVRDGAPEAYQRDGPERSRVPAAYRLFEDGTVGFAAGRYDNGRDLVIDPAISYSTYFGGSRFDAATATAVDAAGNIYLAGWTESSDFPTQSPAQGWNAGGVDAFIAKVHPTSGLVYCTYLGGRGDDRALGIALDASGSAYVTGFTTSSDFPTVRATQSASAGGRDAFAAKLAPDGASLIYSTYLGGAGSDGGNAVAVDSSGNAFIVGETSSVNFPVLFGAQMTAGGGPDAFVVKLNPFGGLVYGSFLGGWAADRATAVALDSAGSAFVAGATTSPDFPVWNAVQNRLGGVQDAFVTKLDPSGSRFLYSTYLGGGGTGALGEAAFGIGVDSSGAATVVGTTNSADFPVAAAYQPKFGGGGNDAFVARVSASGTALIYSTYLGGGGLDVATAVRVDASGAAVVVGATTSPDFPLASPAQTTNSSTYDTFIVGLPASGKPLLSATFVGGTGPDWPNAVTTGANGAIYVAGQTLSVDFPLVQAIQQLNRGGFGAFLTKLTRIVDDDFYVSQLYLDLLGRSPDAGGLTYWINALKSGLITRTDLAYQFFSSPEFRDSGLFVISLYSSVLGRDADFRGWWYYLRVLQAGVLTPEQLTAIFTQSQEFQATFGVLDDAAFVRRVYLNALGREPGPDEAAYWTQRLQHGAISRSSLMYQFTVSGEFQARIRTHAFATLLYLGFLRRSPEPAGVAYWTSRLDSGLTAAAAVAAFIGSPEYLARF